MGFRDRSDVRDCRHLVHIDIYYLLFTICHLPFVIYHFSFINNYKNKKIMNYPKDIKYTNEHEWIRVEGDEAVVGITDYAQDQLGDIVYLDITSVGETLGQNEVFGTVEAVKTVSELYLPVAGEVLEMNESLNDHPELVNSDPYGEGWIVKIRIDNAAELEGLLDADAYQALL